MTLTDYRRGRVGWSIALTTRRHRHTLSIDRPSLTKLARRPLNPTDRRGPSTVHAPDHSGESTH